MTKRSLTWFDVENACFHITRRIKEANHKVDTIIAVAKGGLIPARIVGRYFDIDRIYCVGAESYSNMTGGDIKVYQGLPMLDSMNVLIVDDISDRGDTLDEVKVLCEGVCPIGAKIITAAPYFKTGTKHNPDFTTTEFSKDEWVVFPWENPPPDME